MISFNYWSIVKAENDEIDFSPLKEWVGEMIKIVYLENPDITQTEQGESDVEIGTLDEVKEDRIIINYD